MELSQHSKKQPDPYEFMRVTRDARPEEIRAAYRNRAKELHPDAGGTHDDFAFLGECEELLLDPERRKHFDETGEWTNEMAAKRDYAVNLLSGILTQILEQGGQHHNILAMASREVTRKREEVGRQITITEARVGKLRAWAKRLKAKPGKENLLSGVLDAQAATLEGGLVQQRNDLVVLDIMLAMLDDHEWEPVEQIVLNQMRFMQSNTTNTSTTSTM